jgi:nitroreductase
MSEVERRKISSNEITIWVKYVIGKFNAWEQQRENMAEYGSKENDAHKLSTTSVRFWSSKIPDEDKIANCIAAGQLAPASCNRQAFKVGILKRDKVDVQSVRGASNPSMFKVVPYRIFVFVNRDNYAEKYSQFIDVGMFSQNFILQAKMEDLATCCSYASEHLDQSQDYWRNYFGLSSEYYCALTILVGYPDEVAVKPPRLAVNEIIVRKTI